MTKYTNPFFALNEVINTLKAYGTNPLQSGATYPAEAEAAKPSWPEHILSITTDKVYAEGTHFYQVSIHMDSEGFEEVAHLIGKEHVVPINRWKFNDDYEMFIIEPSPLLKLFKLEPKFPEVII